VFFQEFLHICVVKFIFHIGLQIFRTSPIVSNYLCYRCSRLISILCFERYDLCTQHVNNGKNVVITFVELCVRAYFCHISLPQIIVSVNYDTSLWKIFSRWSVQFFHHFSRLHTHFFVIIYDAKNVTKILQRHNCYKDANVVDRCFDVDCVKLLRIPVSIIKPASRSLDNG